MNNLFYIGSLPSCICQLREVENLNFFRTELNGFMEDTDCLENLQKLTRLTFSLAHVNSTFPTSIGKLKNLRELSFAHNNLHGTLPSEIGEATNLRILHLQGICISFESTLCFFLILINFFCLAIRQSIEWHFTSISFQFVEFIVLSNF